MLSRRIAMSFVLLGCATSAVAFDLGDIRVYSTLDEPLSAEIPIQDIDESSKTTNFIRLATPDEYSAAGLQYLPILDSLSFIVETDANGNKVLKILTMEPVTVTGLNLLLMTEVQGRLNENHYAVLIEPFNEHVRQVQLSPLGSISQAGVLGPIRYGETLWSIADRVSDSNISIYQTMQAIYESNPYAFTNSNQNNLLEDSVLWIPSADDISVINPDWAQSQFKEQQEIWAGNQPVLVSKKLTYENNDSNSSEIMMIAMESLQEQELAKSPKGTLKLLPVTESSQDYNLNFGVAMGASDSSNDLSFIREQLLLTQERAEVQQQTIDELTEEVAVLVQTLSALMVQLEASMAAEDNISNSDYSNESFQWAILWQTNVGRLILLTAILFALISLRLWFKRNPPPNNTKIDKSMPSILDKENTSHTSAVSANDQNKSHDYNSVNNSSEIIVDKDEDWSELSERVKFCMSSSRFKQAEHILALWLGHHPSHLNAKWLLGEIYVCQGREEDLELWSQSMTKNINDEDSLQRLAEMQKRVLKTKERVHHNSLENGMDLPSVNNSFSTKRHDSATDESMGCETKLDLAQAYIEMGDKKGAQEILDEVVIEGSHHQIKKAKKILSHL